MNSPYLIIDRCGNAVEYGAPFDEPRDGVRARISALFGGLTECAKE